MLGCTLGLGTTTDHPKIWELTSGIHIAASIEKTQGGESPTPIIVVSSGGRTDSKGHEDFDLFLLHTSVLFELVTKIGRAHV